jgi:hypothetical protein
VAHQPDLSRAQCPSVDRVASAHEPATHEAACAMMMFLSTPVTKFAGVHCRINTTTCVWVLLPNKEKSLAPQLGKPNQVVVRPIDSSVQQGRCDGGPFYTGGNALDHRHRLQGLPEGVRSMLIACNISAHHLISKRGTGAIHCRIVTLCTTCVANAVEGVLETST